MHFYKEYAYNDMTAEELQTARRYSGPWDLYRQLQQLQPAIVQGTEPFFIRQWPCAAVAGRWAHHHGRPLVVASLENLPLESKWDPVTAKWVQVLARPYLRTASVVIAVNGGAERNLRKAGADPDTLVRMMYGTWGVDTSEFSPIGPRAQLAADVPVVLFLGRIDRAKGVFELVSAFRMVLDHVAATLVVVGDGPDMGALRSHISLLRLGSGVRLLGQVKNREVPMYMRAATILVAPSRTTKKWAEQVGMSVLQAMACGTAVVSTRSGSIEEFVTDGETGLLVPEGNAHTLADVLRRVLADEGLRRSIAQNARVHAMAKYDAETNVHAAEELLLAAVDRHPRQPTR